MAADSDRYSTSLKEIEDIIDMPDLQRPNRFKSFTVFENHWLFTKLLETPASGEPQCYVFRTI